MKRTTNPYDILNSFANNRPYTTLDKEYETKETISKKYGGEVNRYIKEPYNIKILDKESVQNKLHNTINKIDSYEKQVEKQGQQINFSTEISTADTLFKGMKTYHDTSFEGLCDYANNVLHDFEIEAVKILGDQP